MPERFKVVCTIQVLVLFCLLVEPTHGTCRMHPAKSPFTSHPQPTPTTTSSRTHIPWYLFCFHPLAGCCSKSSDRQTNIIRIILWFINIMLMQQCIELTSGYFLLQMWWVNIIFPQVLFLGWSLAVICFIIQFSSSIFAVMLLLLINAEVHLFLIFAIHTRGARRWTHVRPVNLDHNFIFYWILNFPNFSASPQLQSLLASTFCNNWLSHLVVIDVTLSFM